MITGLISCSPRGLIVNEISDIAETGVIAFEQDDDLDMVEKSMPGNIKLLEVLLQNNQDNHKILILLSKFYAAYSFGFVEDKLESYIIGTGNQSLSGYNLLKENANRYYSRGTEYALRALRVRHPGAAEKLKIPESAESLLKSAGREDVPALFWYGFNLSLLINNNRDSVTLLSKAYLIEKIMKRITELDPEYFSGGAHLVLLSYYSSLPPYSEDKLALSLFHYRKLKEKKVEPSLLADLFYARYYLTGKQDKEKFIYILNELLNGSGGRKETVFYDRIASKRAKIYLDGIDHFFE